jgi:hypothetical protein
MEYLVLTGFTLLILSILLVAAYTKMSSSEIQIDMNSAERAVLEMKRAADFAYIHGHPTKLTIDVYLPSNIESAYSFMGNSTINLAMDVGGVHTDVWRSTLGEVGWDLSGSTSLPKTEGYYLIVVESTDFDLYNGTINIHE